MSGKASVKFRKESLRRSGTVHRGSRPTTAWQFQALSVYKLCLRASRNRPRFVCVQMLPRSGCLTFTGGAIPSLGWNRRGSQPDDFNLARWQVAVHHRPRASTLLPLLPRRIPAFFSAFLPTLAPTRPAWPGSGTQEAPLLLQVLILRLTVQDKTTASGASEEGHSPESKVMAQSDQALALLELLRQHWGHQGFRPLQLQALQATLQGKDSLVILPTGVHEAIA